MDATWDVVRGVLTEHHEMLSSEIVSVVSIHFWKVVQGQSAKSATPGDVFQVIFVSVTKYADSGLPDPSIVPSLDHGVHDGSRGPNCVAHLVMELDKILHSALIVAAQRVDALGEVLQNTSPVLKILDPAATVVLYFRKRHLVIFAASCVAWLAAQGTGGAVGKRCHCVESAVPPEMSNLLFPYDRPIDQLARPKWASKGGFAAFRNFVGTCKSMFTSLLKGWHVSYEDISHGD